MENKTMGFLLGVAVGASGALTLLSPQAKAAWEYLENESMELAKNGQQFVKNSRPFKKAAPPPANPWLVGGICGAVGATAAALLVTNLPKGSVAAVKKALNGRAGSRHAPPHVHHPVVAKAASPQSAARRKQAKVRN